MDMKPVASSNIQAVGYDESTETMRVQFNNSSVYEYHNIPLIVYNDFMQASSLGAYLNRNIRNNYSYEKIA
ncbi:MAG: KTSC domain-containing protein [Candidatus Omnitrophica bacterium]|nr:KTSC domain-containing protein [Candidatus Omnitrophota bacterium]MDD5351720.1 KTSC domain-containing protein [Candidatus Omnitrophota bacterium]MDD5550930.1 KTSC domain-containing protein [Candidatus Omnitrophota bacterium]